MEFISRPARWASAWAVVDVEPTHDIKKRNSLSITQLICSLQKTCQTVQKCKTKSSSIAYFSIFGLLPIGLENKSLLVSKSSGGAGEWVAGSCPRIFNSGLEKRYYFNHFWGGTGSNDVYPVLSSSSPPCVHPEQGARSKPLRNQLVIALLLQLPLLSNSKCLHHHSTENHRHLVPGDISRHLFSNLSNLLRSEKCSDPSFSRRSALCLI